MDTEESEEIKRFKEFTRAVEFKQLRRALGRESDPTMIVLRSHLYVENLLERILLITLSRGDKLIESGNLTFHQKLVLVDSLDCMPDEIVSSLRGLNKLRNQCAHELDKQIQMADITKLGSPLGKRFSKIKKDCKFAEVEVLQHVLLYVVGFLAGLCTTLEHK